MEDTFKSKLLILITIIPLVFTSCGKNKSNNPAMLLALLFGGSNSPAEIPFDSGEPVSTDQTVNYQLRLSSSYPSLYDPKIESQIDLYVATGASRPIAAPSGAMSGTMAPGMHKAIEIIVPPIITTSLGSRYTAISGGVFVDNESSSVRWFYYRFKNSIGIQIGHLVYQVAKNPFPGKEEKDWEHPHGLVKTGTLTANTDGEFSIDLKEDIILTPGQTSAMKPIPRPRQTYYVRVFPVDILGNPMGDPGRGVAIHYGRQTMDPFVSGGDPASPSFELRTPRYIMGSYHPTTEFWCYDYPVLQPGAVDVEPKGAPIIYTYNTVTGDYDITEAVSDATRMFSIVGLDPSVSRVLFQVSDRPYDASSTWGNTTNIVYEKSFDLPISADDMVLPSSYHINTFNINYTGLDCKKFEGITLTAAHLPSNCAKTILLDFNEFGKTWRQMKDEDKVINYYVRAIGLKKGSQAGLTIPAFYSNTVTINYVWKKTGTFLYTPTPPKPPEDRIHAVIPGVRIKSYTPIKFENHDYMNHYYAFRDPKCDEIACVYKKETGEKLYPLQMGKYLGVYPSSMQPAEYEATIIRQFITTGTKIYFPPPAPNRDDDSFWEELWETATGFFTNIYDAITSIYTSVQTAYENVKRDLINFVVDLCPVGDLKDAFRAALTALVDTGLMAAGIPPTIPNFDQLIDGNIEYLAQVALTEAGVPAANIAADVVANVASGIRTQIAEEMNHEDPNPVSAPFIKLDPEYQYQPAYLDIEITNPSSEYNSAPGSFDIITTFEFDYYDTFSDSYGEGIFLTARVLDTYVSGDLVAWEYRHHFFNHLNGGACDAELPENSGQKVVYDVFKPVIGWKFPLLKPGETKTVRVYLEEYHGVMTRYPGGEKQESMDFYNIYFNGYDHHYGTNSTDIPTFFYLNTTLITPQKYLIDYDSGFIMPHTNGVPIYNNKYSPPSTHDAINDRTITPWTR